ncbi:MAG: DUF4105 domain-containing protein [Planctomycetota bacterium]|nr:MAG: DUF4105 domain-containing protein [Planctomycetota bacterium]
MTDRLLPQETTGAPCRCLLMALCLTLSLGCGRWVTRTQDHAASRAAWWAALRPDVRPFTGGAEPSHRGNWRPDLMVLPYAEVEPEQVILHNIRDCVYRTEEDYDVRHFDRVVRLADLRTLDFIVVPFKESDALAHTMLSFGLADGQHIVFSAEARLEEGEQYALVPSATRQYELMWVVGTERDLILLRTHVRDVDVYLYPIRVTPEQTQRLFLAAVQRVNQIAQRPEHYDLFTNNCTTNIVNLVNQLSPGKIPLDVRVLLPGRSDRLAYDLGLLAIDGPFDQIKAACKINTLAKLHADAADFSAAIRPHAKPLNAPSR